jgi:hypothetical protein
MEVELVFAGLTTFVNIDNADESVLAPSAILLNADYEGPFGASAKMPGHHHGGGMLDDVNPNEPDYTTHIPFIAFDSRLAKVDDDTGFEPVPGAERFLFLDLDKYHRAGVEITIQGHRRYVPTIDHTFTNIASRAMYWPESVGQWNHDCVPIVGERPKKEAVKAFFRFGPGKLQAGRLCPYKWKFTKLNGDTIVRHFAEEASYTYRDTERNEVIIDIFDLEEKRPNDTNPLRKLTFSPEQRKTRELTLFIGNNILSDIDIVVRRRRATVKVGPSSHFSVFNNVVDVGEAGKPKPPEGIPPNNIDNTGGGGQDGGICGPTG